MATQSASPDAGSEAGRDAARASRAAGPIRSMREDFAAPHGEPFVHLHDTLVQLHKGAARPAGEDLRMTRARSIAAVLALGAVALLAPPAAADHPSEPWPQHRRLYLLGTDAEYSYWS